MKPIGDAFKEVAKIVKDNLTEEGSGVECDFCGDYVPAIHLDIPGLNIQRWVQPKCKCVVEANEAERRKFEKRTEELEIRKLFSISQLGERLINARFEDFKPRNGSEMAYKASSSYAKGFSKENGVALMLWGEPGNGKSLLAACVNNEVQNKGFTTVFTSMPDLLSKIKATFNKDNKESEQQILKALDMCDLLIIDDLGAEKTTDWVEELVFMIIDNRYRKKKPIFVTTNLDPNTLKQKIGSRSADRVQEICIEVKNEASSFRKQKADSMKAAMLKKLTGE